MWLIFLRQIKIALKIGSFSIARLNMYNTKEYRDLNNLLIYTKPNNKKLTSFSKNNLFYMYVVHPKFNFVWNDF